MPDQREEVLNFIKYNGPVLPVQIAKHINTNILFASAILSELVSRNMLKITHASIGGSPLYYLTGQEDGMDSRLCTSLGGKEKEAYQLLKENGVLWEKQLEPWQRVAVRSLKDFAVSITVKEGENNEVFWKHHLVGDEEAKLIISEIMGDLSKKQQQVQELVSNINKKENIVTNILSSEPQVVDDVQIQNPFIIKKDILDDKKNLIKETQAKRKEPLIQESLVEEDIKNIKQKEAKRERKEDIKFYSRVLEFIKDNNVEILKEEIIKKDKEIDFVVNLPTGFGRLKYLIKAKNKTSINEADISMAFSEGQIKKMPVILLTNGKLNKKASLLVEQKMAGQLTLKEV